MNKRFFCIFIILLISLNIFTCKKKEVNEVVMTNIDTGEEIKDCKFLTGEWVSNNSIDYGILKIEMNENNELTYQWQFSSTPPLWWKDKSKGKIKVFERCLIFYPENKKESFIFDYEYKGRKSEDDIGSFLNFQIIDKSDIAYNFSII